jgi:hypothetical protein
VHLVTKENDNATTAASPPPWSIEELEACFVDDAQSLSRTN